MQPAPQHKYYRGQLVEVLSAAEIAATLDANGTLDGLPFMAEMLAFCGRRMRVQRRADRTCVGQFGFRRMRAAVFLQGARCDGSGHDGCARACLLFWKEAWLKPAADGAAPAASASETVSETASETASEAASAPSRARTCISHHGERYICQSTELANATTGLFSRWDARPMLRDIWHGELTVSGFLELVGRTVLNRLGLGLDRPLLGSAGKKQRGQLALREGEWVAVKSAEQIAEQLDTRGANCGLVFRPTMHASIGRQFKVAFVVDRLIDEGSGKMVHLKNTVALQGVTCRGPCAANCPRDEFLYWRESWLERVPAASAGGRADAAPPVAEPASTAPSTRSSAASP